MIEGTELITLEAVKSELNLVLNELMISNKIDENTISQLEYDIEQLESIDLDSVDQDIIEDIITTLELAQTVVSKHKEKQDNTTLVKTTMYITRKQLHYLDTIADEENFKGQGRRSVALRHVLNEKII